MYGWSRNMFLELEKLRKLDSPVFFIDPPRKLSLKDDDPGCCPLYNLWFNKLSTLKTE